MSRDDRPAADWVRLAEFLAGQRLDRSGAAEPLSSQEMQQDWEYLRARYPQDFTVTAEQAFALFHTLHGGLEWPLLSGRPVW